jgi:hypothetical protein
VPPPELAEILAAQSASPEQSLLAAAAALDLFHRAGAIPETNTADIPTAPPETLPALSPTAAALLSRLIADPERHSLFPEFFAATAAAHRRLPESTLPTLLNHAVTKAGENIRTLLSPILGARGHWLLTLNPTWQPLTTTPSPAEFDTAPKETRLAILKNLRATEPALARQLLEKSWPTESADDRARFLPLLLPNLSLADEPFLEAALDDKKKDVREAAADLLARLPQSALAHRMQQRAAACFTLTTKLLRKTTVTLTPPDTRTPDMERDGITEKLAHSRWGPKAWWLHQIIAATPLAFYTLPPDELLVAIAKSDYADAFFVGIARAAARQQDPAFAAAVLRVAAQLPAGEFAAVHDLLPDLFRALPPDNRETLALSLLTASRESSARAALLRALPPTTGHAWSEPFSHKLAALLDQFMTNTTSHDYYFAEALSTDVALRLHPAAATRIATAAETTPQWLARALDTLHATLTFRHQYLQELQK